MPSSSSPLKFHPFSRMRMTFIVAVGLVLAPVTMELRNQARAIEPGLTIHEILSGPADRTAKIYAAGAITTLGLGGLALLSFSMGAIILTHRRTSGLPMFRPAAHEIEPHQAPLLQPR